MPDDKTEHRRLAAIMFTDMVGYSVLAAEGAATANGVEANAKAALLAPKRQISHRLSR
jgi:hypothetical protein